MSSTILPAAAIIQQYPWISWGAQRKKCPPLIQSQQPLKILKALDGSPCLLCYGASGNKTSKTFYLSKQERWRTKNT